MNHGFSLTEVVVSLCLITGISLMLFKQQLHITQVMHQYQQHTLYLLKQANQAEYTGVAL